MAKFVDLEIPFDEAENYFKPNNREKLNKLFYKDRNFEKLLQDTTYFLIGEKGSGKTTYCAYFCNNTIENTRSKRYAMVSKKMQFMKIQDSPSIGLQRRNLACIYEQ